MGYDQIILQRTACLVVSIHQQSRLPLWLCDDRTDLVHVLHDYVGLNQETERKRRNTVLGLFGRALNGFFCSCSDFRNVIEYFGYCLKQFIYPNNKSMFYISLHAVLPLLMLQTHRTGITFIYTVRFVGDRWDEGEVERS